MQEPRPEKTVLPTPHVADRSAAPGERLIIGKLIRRGEKPSARQTGRPKRRFFRGNGAGFTASAIVHAAFLIFALFWITERIRKAPEEETVQAFVTGSGGGQGGENQAHRAKAHKVIPPRPPKILSKSASATIALPEFNVKMPAPTSFSQSIASLSAGGLANGGSGFGGGSGGGIGTGIGIGIGNGKNLVGAFAPRKVMGANIVAEKVAVYLDCSGSMSPYLPQVRNEIYDKYPDADIFEFDGIRTLVHDGEIIGGKHYKDKSPVNNRYGIRLDGTEKEKLSNNGKRIHKKYATNFEQGSVGAWIDIMMNERYDALVIFSDFQDGIRQYSKDGKTIFADSSYQPTETDERKNRDIRWQNRWHATLKRRKNSLRSYLFTIGINPQKFLADCVELSSGAITDVRYLREAVEESKPRPRRRGSRSRRQSEIESPVETL